MSKMLEYTVVFPNGREIRINSIKLDRKFIVDYLAQNPLETVKVYRGKRLYCKYGLIDGELGKTGVNIV